MTVEQELDLYKKALYLITDWAEECDFGYDNIPEEYDRYSEDIDNKGLGYIEGLMYIVLKEAQKENFSPNMFKEIENVCSEIKKMNNLAFDEISIAIERCLKTPLVLEDKEKRKEKLEQERDNVNFLENSLKTDYIQRLKMFTI